MSLKPLFVGFFFPFGMQHIQASIISHFKHISIFFSFLNIPLLTLLEFQFFLFHCVSALPNILPNYAGFPALLGQESAFRIFKRHQKDRKREYCPHLTWHIYAYSTVQG